MGKTIFETKTSNYNFAKKIQKDNPGLALIIHDNTSFDLQQIKRNAYLQKTFLFAIIQNYLFKILKTSNFKFLILNPELLDGFFDIIKKPG